MTSKDHFIFYGWDTVELARKFGTPLYVLSEKAIKEKCERIREGFLKKYPGTKAHYASKAFLTLAMCRIMAREGMGLDVVSGGELQMAWKAGFPLDKVSLHGNNKSLSEIEMAMELGVGTIVVDNAMELEAVIQKAEQHDQTQDILLRISPGINVKTHKYISTGHAGSKFGLPAFGEEIETVEERAVSSEWVNLRGYHFHLGSLLYERESYIMAVDVILDMISSLKERHGQVIEEINIGGGFGIPVMPGDRSPDITEFTDPVMERVIEKCTARGLNVPVLSIEPGRWIISEAGITLYRAGFIKEIPELVKYISVDGGMTDNPRPALYGSKYYAVNAERYGEEKTEKVTIVGKCCESGDVLVRDIDFPRMKPGEIIAVFNTGAYNFSMASNYNAALRPAVVLLGDDTAEVIVRRQTYEDILRGQFIPERLSE